MARIASQLYELALEHEGLFTMGEAEDAGIAPNTLVAAARRGAIERLSRGIYRLRNFPADEHVAQLWEAVLWPSIGRGPGVSGVISHLTALAEHYRLLEYAPPKVDITLPKGTRIRRQPPPWLHVHYADLDESGELDEVAELPMTSLTRTIQDCIDADVDRRLIRKVLENAINRGVMPDVLAPSMVRDFLRQIE